MSSALPTRRVAWHALVLLALGAAAPALAQDRGTCTQDSECDGGLVCMRVVLAIDCAPDDASCEGAQELQLCTEPDPEPLACDADAQCPAPLTCDEDNERGPLCAFDQLIHCSTQDSECPAGFECVDLGELGGCTECADDSDDSTCSPVDCAVAGLNLCSPKAVACQSDADCEDAFTCGEIGAFDLQTGWSEELVGTRGCLSDAYTALNEGRVQGGDQLTTAGGDAVAGSGGAGGAGASGAAAGQGAAGGASGGASGASAGSGGSAGMMDPYAKSSDGGCRVSSPRRATSAAAWWLVALALLARKRRTRA